MVYYRKAPEWGLVDVPNQRSSHIRVTPRGGGVVFILFWLVFGVAWMSFAGNGEEVWNLDLVVFVGLSIGVGILGLVDDRLTLSSGLRLLVQLLVAVTVVSLVRPFDALTLPGLPSNAIPVLGYGITVLWILGLTNVYNFMDGIDGIAAGQGIVAALGWAVAAHVFFASEVFVVLNLLLAAVLSGFLVWNWHPAKVFMGDVGSAFLGFYFATQPLVLLNLPDVPDRAGLLVFLSAFMVWPFIFDGFFTFCRRALRRENVLQAHRTHLYQRLTKLGWTHRRVAIIYVGWALVCGFLAGVYLYGGIKGWTVLQWVAIAFQVVSGISMVALVTVLEKRMLRFRKVYLSAPAHSSIELDYVTEVLRSDWIAPIGPNLDLFEEEMAEYVGVKNACAVASGTAGLHLLLRALGIGHGDKVLVSDFTFVATVNPIIYVGAEPILLDADRATWNAPLDRVKEAVEAVRMETGKTPKALILAHVYGICSDVESIGNYCREKGVLLIEDAAEAVGSFFRGRHLGSFGDAAIFSFNGNKILTTGGGGMVVSEDRNVTDKVRFLASQAKEKVLYYEHRDLGYNERMSNVLAAIGRAQLRRLPTFLDARERHNRFYRAMVSDHPGVTFMPVPEDCNPNYWLTNILIDSAKAGFSARQLIEAMDRARIEVRPLWKPMHAQPYYQKRGTSVFGGEIGDDLFDKGVSLPSGSAMTDHDRERVAEVWKRVAGGG